MKKMCVWAAIAAGALAVFGGAKQIGYIGASSGGKPNALKIVEVDIETGAIETVGSLPLAETTYIAVNRARTRLYTSFMDASLGPKGKNGGVAVYALDPSGKNPVRLDAIATGRPSPCHLSLAPDEKKLVFAEYGQGTAGWVDLHADGTFRKDTLGGIVSQDPVGPSQPRQDRPHCHCARVTPDGKYVCIVDLGTDRVKIFSTKDGSFVRDLVTTPAGAGPRHLVFHPNGQFAFLLFELENYVTSYRYADGNFTPVMQLKLTPDGFTDFSKAAAIKLSADGSELYCSNRGHESLAVFSVDADTGALVRRGIVKLDGAFPWDFEVMPGGKVFAVAFQRDGVVRTYRYDRAACTLAPLADVNGMGSTFCSCYPLYQPAPSPLKTVWGEKITPENAWREYPRPQMTRPNWTNLNGLWDYAITSVTNTPGRPTAWNGKILVPFAPESALSGVGRLVEPDEFLWYTRTIRCDKKPGERILLHFGGVDFRTMVFIGHSEVTDVPHEGGQNAWTVDVTDYVKDGDNELTLCVWDPTEAFINSRGKQSFKPAGCYYTRVSGVWQTVWMENVPETHVESYTVVADIDKGTATFRFAVTGPDVGGSAAVEVYDGSTCVAKGAGKATGAIEIAMPKDFRLWSPETPNLYTFKATCGKDAVNGYFGMRKFSKGRDAKGNLRFCLNNKPYFVIGTLDQGWWPDGLLTPPSDAAMAHDIATLKACGFNTMRKHIKVEPLRYYYLCDTLGLLVLQDLPSGNGDWKSPMLAQTTGRYGLERVEQKQMMDALQTIPSIVMWCPYNEGWSQPGEFLTHAMLDFVRRYDPTRLVNGPSGCWDWEGGHLLPKGWKWEDRVLTQHKPAGVCEAADAVDMHLYRGPTMFDVNDRRVSFLGEFGGLGHPVEGHLWKVSPKGNWGYGGIEDTKTREGLEKTYLGLMDQLGALADKGLGGSIYTQTTDVEIEINGLMTYDRKVLKYNPAVLKAAHEKICHGEVKQEKNR